jgi:hypothetical protein
LDAGWLAALAPFAFLAYFAPFLIAFERRHRFLWTIGVFNAVTGWTLLGWVASLVWAVNKDVRALTEELSAPLSPSPLEPSWNPGSNAHPISSGEFKHCPYCAEAIRAEALVCRYCSRELTGAEPAKPATDLALHEKRQLQNLLVDAADTPSDRSLLDVFEYGRLLEAEENGTVLTLVGGSSTPPPMPSSVGEAASRPQSTGTDWDDVPPDAARVAAR